MTAYHALSLNEQCCAEDDLLACGARQAPHTLLPPCGALQPHQIKVGLKHTYDARFGSICIKTLTPLHHNLLRTPMTLFENILANPQHVLRHLLPSRTQHSYKLRPRRHDCSLTVKSDARNFITRQLFKDM